MSVEVRHDLEVGLEGDLPHLTFLVLADGASEPAGRVLRHLGEPAADGRPWLVVLERASPDEIFDFLDLGAADFLTPPLSAAGVLPRLWRALEHAPRRSSTVHRLKESLGLKRLVGDSPVFVAAIRKIPLVARCDATVLISGETGTGKELCARALHYLSPRSAKAFVPVNCGALPVDLVENELFGHERSAFTGAGEARPGLIAEADGGTLFLDEIDSLQPPAQVKLLRFLQEREYRRLGSTKTRKADVRVLAATNEDPESAIEQGRLRRDLYYRIGTIPLHLPPLRDRREDVPLLVRHFLDKYNRRFDRDVRCLTAAAMQKLMLYDWPGNVRELENVVERAVVLSERKKTVGAVEVLLPRSAPEAESFREAKARIVAGFERRYLRQMLAAHDGNISKAAEASQKNRRAFFELMRKHGIDARKYRT